MKHTTHLYYLSNGIPVVVSNTFFQTCKILISLDFGASDETQGEYGITHFIEHLLGQSVSGETSFGNLQKKIERLGGNIGLYTSYTKIGCWVNVIPENLVDAVKIIAPQIMTPLFDEQKIKQEKNIILDEYNRVTDKKSWALFKYKHLFKGTGFGHNILGTPENIQSFSKEVVSNYYFSHLSSDKCNIVIVGCVQNIQNLLLELEKAFSNMPSVAYEHKNNLVQQTFVHETKNDAKNVKLVLAFCAKIADNREEQIAVNIFRIILQKRLIDVLRYKKGLVYTIICQTIGGVNTKLYTIETENSAQHVECIVKDIAVVCKNILNAEPITKEELQTAKNIVKYSLLREMDSIDVCCDIYSKYLAYYKKLYSLDTEKQMIDSLDVADVSRIGRLVFYAPLSVVSQGPEYNCSIIDVWNKIFN